MISHRSFRSRNCTRYSLPVSGSTEVRCPRISRLTMAFLMMLWQAGTLDSLLFRDEPLTGNAASAGSSSSQGMA